VRKGREKPPQSTPRFSHTSVQKLCPPKHIIAIELCDLGFERRAFKNSGNEGIETQTLLLPWVPQELLRGITAPPVIAIPPSTLTIHQLLPSLPNPGDYLSINLLAQNVDTLHDRTPTHRHRSPTHDRGAANPLPLRGPNPAHVPQLPPAPARRLLQ
jgi:hypothetical protein